MILRPGWVTKSDFVEKEGEGREGQGKRAERRERGERENKDI